jgi:hypothetical protein
MISDVSPTTRKPPSGKRSPPPASAAGAPFVAAPRRGRHVDERRAALFHRNMLRFREQLSQQSGHLVTTEQLAVLSGVGIDTVRKCELQSGRTTQKLYICGRDALLAFARVFGRDVDDFFMEDPPPPQPLKQTSAIRLSIAGPVSDDIKRKAIAFEREINQENLMQLEKTILKERKPRKT